MGTVAKKPNRKRAAKVRVKRVGARGKGSAARRSGKGRPAGKAFEDLVALQARLLAPGGCPWDREQTHESLRTYLIEEAYEVLDALESGDSEKFAGELGDLLLQVIFHARLAEQAGRFDIRDVIEHIHTKMVRRHPHVFGDAKAKNAGEVLKNWERIKLEERAAEKKGKKRKSGSADAEAETSESLLDGVPRSLPAVLEAYQLTRRASRVGFDWENAGAVLEKLHEESAELNDEIGRDPGDLEEEAGDLLFAAVNVARFLKIDPEIALKKANRKFERRFRKLEEVAAKSGKKLGEMSDVEMDVIWEAIKRHEKTRARGHELPGAQDVEVKAGSTKAERRS